MTVFYLPPTFTEQKEHEEFRKSVLKDKEHREIRTSVLKDKEHGEFRTCVLKIKELGEFKTIILKNQGSLVVGNMYSFTDVSF